MHHVAALPGMVATEGFVESAGGIELVRPLGRLERHIESFQLRFLGSEIFRGLLVPIQPENPIVFRALGQRHRGIAHIGRHNLRHRLPVVPHRGLRDHERARGLLLVKRLDLAPNRGRWGGRHGHPILEFQAGLRLGIGLPIRLAFDDPILRGWRLGGGVNRMTERETQNGECDGNGCGFFHLGW